MGAPIKPKTGSKNVYTIVYDIDRLIAKTNITQKCKNN